MKTNIIFLILIAILLVTLLYSHSLFRDMRGEIDTLNEQLSDTRQEALETIRDATDYIAELEGEIARQRAEIFLLRDALDSACEWEPVGSFKRTFYGTVPGVTGDIGASGRKLFDGAFAMRPATMAQYGISLGDEICLVLADGEAVYGVVLDHAVADVIDEYRTGAIPAFGTDVVDLWVKRYD